jgi:hypothetical protein
MHAFAAHDDSPEEVEFLVFESTLGECVAIPKDVVDGFGITGASRERVEVLLRDSGGRRRSGARWAFSGSFKAPTGWSSGVRP